MDLSCAENRDNARYQTYLMPGDEINETPEGDLTEDHRRRTSKTRRLGLGSGLRDQAIQDCF